VAPRVLHAYVGLLTGRVLLVTKRPQTSAGRTALSPSMIGCVQ
jgi:hypothetical protein